MSLEKPSFKQPRPSAQEAEERVEWGLTPGLTPESPEPAQKPESAESNFEDTFRQYIDGAKEFDTTKGETFQFIQDAINNGKILELVGVAEGQLGKFKYEHERDKFRMATLDALMKADSVSGHLEKARTLLRSMDKKTEPVEAYQRQLINKYLEIGDLITAQSIVTEMDQGNERQMALDQVNQYEDEHKQAA